MGVRTCEMVFIPLRHQHQDLVITFWCVKEALTMGIFSDAFEDGARGGSEPGLTCGLLSG
jgi:hypothetical protein